MSTEARLGLRQSHRHDLFMEVDKPRLDLRRLQVRGEVTESRIAQGRRRRSYVDIVRPPQIFDTLHGARYAATVDCRFRVRERMPDRIGISRATLFR